MEAKQIPLETLLRWLWEDNPKLHQDVMIRFSMSTYGFNDRVGVCVKYQLVLEGHGRLGNLKYMKDLLAQGDTTVTVPANIVVADDGDWLIPCDDHDQFASREAAYQYALLHNRSGVAALDLRDYDISKLQKAINKASQGQQMGFELFGFTAGDFASGATDQGVSSAQSPDQPAVATAPTSTGVVQLPKAAVFDPSQLADAPTYQANQAPQSFVAMVTAPDQATFLKMLSALTFGERKSLPEGARFAAVDGVKFLPEWTRLLVAKETLVIPVKQPDAVAPLPGQITLAGDVIGDAPQSATTLMAGDSVTVRAPIDAQPQPATEPIWDTDGNCPTCEGKGFTGTRVHNSTHHKIYCTACNGLATQAAWHDANQPQ